ncbi:hypothetical protein JTB14_027111 [Gonioctena quinquepunctata]|nr:hypothetical protein JTB14_027111 [Gonioctena quinquepunctata]
MPVKHKIVLFVIVIFLFGRNGSHGNIVEQSKEQDKREYNRSPPGDEQQRYGGKNSKGIQDDSIFNITESPYHNNTSGFTSPLSIEDSGKEKHISEEKYPMLNNSSPGNLVTTEIIGDTTEVSEIVPNRPQI